VLNAKITFRILLLLKKIVVFLVFFSYTLLTFIEA